MNWNSVMVRIWLPFLMVALLLLYFLAVYVPALQRSTLERFYLSKLQTVALAVENVAGYGLKESNFGMINEALAGIDSLPLLDKMGYLSYDELVDTLEVSVLSKERFGLRDLLREDVGVAELSAVTEGLTYRDVDAFFQGSKLGCVNAEEFMTLMDTSLLLSHAIFENDGIAYQSIVTGSEEKFEDELMGLRQPFIVLQIFLLVGAVSLFYYLAFHISRPLLEIAEVANEMRDGNYDVHIGKVGALDEMGILTQALGQLRDDLNVKRQENDELTNEMESKIVQRTKELEQALQAKDEFLSTMSHEIRTPLHSLIAIGDMLRTSEDHGKREELVASLNTSSKQLLALINDILDFSKISAGKLDLHVEPLSLQEFFDDLVAPFKVMSNANVEFVTVWPEDLPNTTVLGDSMRLSQILHNLLSNAFKFTEKGEVVLAVRLREGKAFNYVRLEVQVLDTGVGIERDNLDLILNAFTQENSSISRKFGGTGLGLSIVNRLLTVMGSQLQIESTVGEGSMFGFELELERAQRPSAKQDEATHDPIVLDGLRMLYVEDMDPNRFVMKAMVKPWNIALDMAESGLNALELVRQNEYDLILMDIQMPEMDGVETLAQMRMQQGVSWSTPVVAFTAHAQDSDVSKYLNAGFREVLTKPAGPDVLRPFLHQFVVNKSVGEG
ncbi:MAG: response regulator [Flavobacteriales bacterium]